MDTQNPSTQATPETPAVTTQTPQAAPPPPPVPEHHGHGKKVFGIVLIGAIVVILLCLLSLSLFNKPQPTTSQQTTALPTSIPTMTLSPTPADDQSSLDSIDTGSPDSDLSDLQKDVNQL